MKKSTKKTAQPSSEDEEVLRDEDQKMSRKRPEA
jgi:hypothetical protein